MKIYDDRKFYLIMQKFLSGQNCYTKGERNQLVRDGLLELDEVTGDYELTEAGFLYYYEHDTERPYIGDPDYEE